jgi:WD40 repeat protein
VDDLLPELRALRSPDAARREAAALALNAGVTRIGGYRRGPEADAHRRRDRRIVAALVRALDDDSAVVRAAAGWALATGKTGYRGHPRGVSVGQLRPLLRARRADTRQWAARVLGAWRDKPSLVALRRLGARDPSPAVRAAARDAIADVRRAWTTREGTPSDQTGHGAIIHAMKISPEGRTIFTAGWDGTVRAWDVRKGRVAWVCTREDLHGKDSLINGIALTPEGRTLAIASVWDGVVLLDAKNGRLRTLVGPGKRKQRFKTIATHGDAVIVGGSSPKTWQGGNGWVRFLDGNGRTTRRLKSPTDVYDVAGSPDGKLVAIRMSEWRVLAVTTGEVILECAPGTEHVTFSPDGALLAGVYHGEGALWDLRTRQLVRTFRHPTDPYRVRIDRCPPAFSPDGTLIAFGQSVFELGTGAFKWRTLDEAWTRAAAFSPDGGPIAFAGDRHAVIVRRPETGEPLGVLGRPRNMVVGLAIAPDGATVAAAYEDAHVRIWDVRRRRLRAELHSEGLRPDRVLFTANGHLIVGGEGGIAVADAGLGALGPVVRPLGATPMSSVSPLPDGRILVGGATVPYEQGVPRVVAWDPGTGIASDVPSPAGGGTASSHDGSRIVTSTWSHARVHDATNPAAQPRELSLPREDRNVEELRLVRFSPDDEVAAVGTDGFHVTLWDAATWEVRRIIHVGGDDVCDLAFSPDGRTLAVATSYASEIELRDVATGAKVGVLDAHTDNARAVAYSPDGATVFTGAADGTIRLWDPRSSRLRATLPPPPLRGPTAS